MRAYIGWLGASVTALVAVILLVSFAVDAYGLYGTRLISEHCFPSTQRFTSPGGDRIIKAIEIGTTRRAEDIVFFGSSRMAVGMDAASPTLRPLKTYNAALVSGRQLENSAAVNYVIEHWPGIGRIIWAVDFDILFDPRDRTGDFEESAFAGQPIWKGMARSLLSFDFVVRTFNVLGQVLHSTVKAEMDIGGRNYFFEEVMRKRSDPRQLFERLERGTYRELSIGAQTYTARVDDRFVRLRQSLAAIKARGIDVDVVTPPLHARMLEVIRLSGQWDAFEDWKRRIAGIVDEVDAGPGAGHVRAVDFAVVHPLTTEEVPAPGATADTKYFYESSHMRPILADAIVAHLLGHDPPIAEGAGFGTPMETAVRDQNLADQRAKLEAWRVAHADEMIAIERLVTQQ